MLSSFGNSLSFILLYLLKFDLTYGHSVRNRSKLTYYFSWSSWDLCLDETVGFFVIFDSLEHLKALKRVNVIYFKLFNIVMRFKNIFLSAQMFSFLPFLPNIYRIVKDLNWYWWKVWYNIPEIFSRYTLIKRVIHGV